MKNNRIVRIIALVLAALLFLGLIATPILAAETEESTSIEETVTEGDSTSLGIIGSADGPTVIFVATPIGGMSFTPEGFALAAAALVVILTAVVILIKKRRK